MAEPDTAYDLRGFVRPDGRVGFRNTVLVVPIVGCLKEIARRTAQRVQGAVALDNPYGCELGPAHLEDVAVQLRGLITHPNVGGVLFLLMGCAATLRLRLPDVARDSGKLVQELSLQETGGTNVSVAKTAQIASGMDRHLADQQRQPVGMESLVIGTKCGASDRLSLGELHPVVGQAADLLVDMGATVVLGEDNELIGCSDDLASRAADQETAEKIRAYFATFKPALEKHLCNPIEITDPLREASRMHAAKAGTRPIARAVHWRDRITGPGLVLYLGPNSDLICVTTMHAAGCNLMLFTTGRGTPVCGPVAPTIKITSTPRTIQRMTDNIDLSLPNLAASDEIRRAAAEEIVAETLAVANGKQTKGERLHHHEMLFFLDGIMD